MGDPNRGERRIARELDWAGIITIKKPTSENITEINKTKIVFRFPCKIAFALCIF
jgi:hypothetical protein